MRKTLVILGVMILAWVHTWADNSMYNQEHENILCVRYGGIWQQDQYLTPLLYSGQQIGLSNEWWQNFHCDSTQHWKHVGKAQVLGGMAYSERWNNLMYSVGFQGGWGAQYVWRWQDLGLQVQLGPYLNVDLLGKMQVSNVNKPYSMDIGIDMCAMCGLSWAFRAKKTSYRLRYLARLNVIGIDYIPDYWQSYYEQTEGVLGLVRCAGAWNHRRLEHELTFDMQFKHSTWRVGIAHEYLEYGMREMMFSRELVSAVLGCVWQYRVAGAKNLTIW